MNRIRAFLAFNLPVATINKVSELQSDLRQRARQAGLKVGWVPPPHMHVTLKFLAEIPEDSVWAVRDRVTEKLAGRPALPLHVRGVGAFPDRERPRVLWVGIESPDGAVARLAADIDDWLVDLGFAREKRPFHPHLTLGRVKAGVGDVLGGLEGVNYGACSLSSVVLYQSVLKRDGAEYSPLATIPLVTAPGVRLEVAPPSPSNGDVTEE
jgi:RNA 2',3'-cyclic 3'-phosphodiesterase